MFTGCDALTVSVSKTFGFFPFLNILSALPVGIPSFGDVDSVGESYSGHWVTSTGSLIRLFIGVVCGTGLQIFSIV